TYQVSDAAGNTAEAVRVVTVADDTPPELTLAGEANGTLACGEAFDEPGFSAVDTCDGELSDSVTVGGAVDETTPGTYTLTYQVSDAAGNTAEAVRVVMVEDDTPPELTLAGTDAITLECGEDYQEPGFAATDTCDGDLTDAVNVESAVDAATPGSYTVTYRVTDRAGNMAEAVRTVTIEDTTPPEVTLLGMAEVEVSCGSAFDDAGAVAVDACEGDLTDAVVVSGTVNTSQPGVYTLTYSATDKAGNTGEAVRAVRILNDCEIGISRQPAPLSLFVGTSAVLSLTATGGSDTLGYTWRKDGNVLNAPDLPRLQLTAVTLEGAGEYTCVVSDGVTSATSDPAIVSVFPLPDTAPHSADTNGDWAIALTELLRIIQFFNAGEFSCQADTEDGYVPGDAGNRDCPFHNSDYEPRDWRLSLTELLRIIQFFNQPASLYHRLEGTEDGFAPGAG
ncbi:MAG: immunoglobulin-like domain-containing protein, partial [Candidatus Hydrogenedentota bacterium]